MCLQRIASIPALHKKLDADAKQMVDQLRLHEMANKLLEVETLGGEEMRAILTKVRPFQPNSNGHVAPPPSPQTSVVVAPGTSATQL